MNTTDDLICEPVELTIAYTGERRCTVPGNETVLTIYNIIPSKHRRLL